MLENNSACEYTQAEALFYSDRPTFNRLFDKRTAAVVDFLQLQIDGPQERPARESRWLSFA
jgi:uroporphyrinogen-III decarboxylase